MWPKDADAGLTNGSSSTAASTSVPASARYTLIDVNRAEANQPIDFVCRGAAWTARLGGVEKYDVLIISGCRVERVLDAEQQQPGGGAALDVDPMECEYRMVVDDSSELASIIVYNWRDRILARPGKLHTQHSHHLPHNHSNSKG